MNNKYLTFLYNSLLLFATWLLMSSNFNTENVIVGVVVSLIVAFIFKKSFLLNAPNLSNIFYFFVYVFILLFEIIKANLQVAMVVLSPKINVNSKIISHKITLKSKIARLVLANSITLTPGTLSVDIEGDELFVHYMNYSDNDNAVTIFHKYLEKIYE